MKAYGGIAETALNFLDRVMKLNLRVSKSEITNPFRIYEHNVLIATCDEPQDEVRMEIARLEETDAAALAQIAQQIELSHLEIAGVTVMESLEILDKLALSLIQWCRA